MPPKLETKTDENGDSSSEVLASVCGEPRCLGETWMCRPSGLMVCAKCGASWPSVSVKQPLP